jgi:hypothetical protein
MSEQAYFETTGRFLILMSRDRPNYDNPTDTLGHNGDDLLTPIETTLVADTSYVVHG